ncbi:MAG: DUF3014 domain-containing protein [Acidobacteriota bacterium]
MESYKKVMTGSMIVTIILFSLFLYFFVFKSDSNKSEIKEQEKSNQQSPVDVREPAPEEQAPDILEILPLEVNLRDSDKVLKELISECSENKKIDKFLNFKGIISRFVASVDSIARGESPVKNLDFLDPFPEFKVKYKGKGLVPDNHSYSRYDLFITIFDSIDNEKLILLYKRSKSLVDTAYSDLGYTETEFNDTLYEAIRVLQRTPVDGNDIFLKKKIITYAFVNPEYENMNNAQKHFFRMGPKNIKIIKQKLIELGALLGFKF